MTTRNAAIYLARAALLLAFNVFLWFMMFAGSGSAEFATCVIVGVYVLGWLVYVATLRVQP